MPLKGIWEMGPEQMLGLWDMQEEIDTLVHTPGRLIQLALPGMKTMSSPSRRREVLSVRLLLEAVWKAFHQNDPAMGECPSLWYEISGKPMLENPQYHISISHSGKLAGVILQKKWPVGLDIETLNPKLKKIEERYLSEPELEWAGSDTTLLRQTLAWCGKEVVVKATGRRDLDFRTQIQTVPFQPQMDGGDYAMVLSLDGNSFRLAIKWFKKDDYVICWSSKEF